MEHRTEDASSFVHNTPQKDAADESQIGDSIKYGSYGTLAAVVFFLLASLFLVPENYQQYQNINKPSWEPGVTLLLTVWVLFLFALVFLASRDHKVVGGQRLLNSNVALGIVMFSVLFYAFALHEMQNFAFAAGFIAIGVIAMLWWLFTVGLCDSALLIVGALGLVWLLVILYHSWTLYELNTATQ